MNLDFVNSEILQIAVIVGAGIGAQWLAQVLRLPSIVLMLGAGALVGPVLGWVDPDALLGDLLTPLVSLAVAIILLEGGLTLRARELTSERTVILRFITVGAVVTLAVGTLAAFLFLDVSLEVAVLLGAILVVSGPTVVGPLLRQIRPHGAVGQILKWESILIDPIGVLLATIVLEVVIARDVAQAGGGAGPGVASVVGQVAAFVGIGVGIGLASALLIAPLLRWHVVPDRLQNSMILAMSLVAFVLSNEVAAESGLLTVTVIGLALANQRWVEVSHTREFKENLVVLVLPAVFVVLAARLDLEQVAAVGWPIAGLVAVLVLIGRPLATWASTSPSTLTVREQGFLAWLAPRGVVAALVASLFAEDLIEHGVRGAELLVPASFGVIGATAIIYGLSSPWVARRLGLADSDPQGILILGAGPVERKIGTALDAAGVDVVLAATSRAHEAEARLSGLRTHFGDLLADDPTNEIDLRGLGRVLAITQNHEFNSLAALHFREDFGRSDVYQLHPTSDVNSLGTETMPGRPLFREGASYEYLAERFIGNERVFVTPITDAYSFEDLKKQRPEMLPLFLLRSGQVQVQTGKALSARAGDRVIYLANPDG